MRVAFLGPEGTVSHEALRSVEGSFQEVPQPTLEAAVLAVRDGAVDRALVPIENALEGSVDPVLDALVFDAERNGVVLSSIAHRDTARLYCKQVVGGRGEHLLSPEEDEAIRLALAGDAAASHTVTLD